MSYNLFLDDIRLPYLNEQELSKIDFNMWHMTSAYYYLKFDMFRNEQWVVVKNYGEFVNYITKHGLPKMISFDHDLSFEHYNSNINYQEYTEKTGYDAAKWLCDYCIEHKLNFPNYIVHSMNVVGKENIINYVENCKKYLTF